MPHKNKIKNDKFTKVAIQWFYVQKHSFILVFFN
jgi:hypothetical protein